MNTEILEEEKNDSPGHEIVQPFGTSKLDRHWLGKKKKRTLCIFPWNVEIFAFLLLYQRQTSKQEREIILSHPVLMHFLPAWWRESKVSHLPQHLKPHVPNRRRRRKVIVQESRPPPHPHTLLLDRAAAICPSGQAVLSSRLFPSGTCKAWSHC